MEETPTHETVQLRQEKMTDEKPKTVGAGTIILTKEVVNQAVAKYLNEQVFGDKVIVKVTDVIQRSEAPFRETTGRAHGSDMYGNEKTFEVQFTE